MEPSSGIAARKAGSAADLKTLEFEDALNPVQNGSRSKIYTKGSPQSVPTAFAPSPTLSSPWSPHRQSVPRTRTSAQNLPGPSSPFIIRSKPRLFSSAYRSYVLLLFSHLRVSPWRRFKRKTFSSSMIYEPRDIIAVTQRCNSTHLTSPTVMDDRRAPLTSEKTPSSSSSEAPALESATRFDRLHIPNTLLPEMY